MGDQQWTNQWTNETQLPSHSADLEDSQSQKRKRGRPRLTLSDQERVERAKAQRRESYIREKALGIPALRMREKRARDKEAGVVRFRQPLTEEEKKKAIERATVRYIATHPNYIPRKKLTAEEKAKRELVRRERQNEAARKKYHGNLEESREKKRAFRLKNFESIRESRRRYRISNIEKVRLRHVARTLKKRQTDPVFRMKHYLRNRLYHYLKSNAISPRTGKAKFGCTPQELRAHIERQFQPGMTWENYGYWHVDHIRPVSSFDFECPGQIEACQHFTNLQPLWASDNIRKSDSWGPSFDEKAEIKTAA